MATKIKNTTKKEDLKVEKVQENVEEIQPVIIEKTPKKVETPILDKGTEKELEDLKAQLEMKDKRIDDMMAAFTELQKQLIEFQNKSLDNAHGSAKVNADSEEILVGSRSVYTNVLATNDGRIVYKFECDEQKYVDSEDLKILLKETGRDYRRGFENGLFYFVDDSNYAKFKIRKKIDLSRENLLRILSLDTNSMIAEIQIMTNGLKDFTVKHTLQFAIARLLIDPEKPLKNWNWESRSSLERYLGQKFDDLLTAVGLIECIGRKKFN